MKLAAAAALGLALLGASPAQEKFKFDEWEAWNSFKEGSSVEFELETGGMKMTMSTVAAKKEQDKISLKMVTKMKLGDSATESPSERSVEKPTSSDSECVLCGKKTSEHPEVGKWSEEKMKVGDRELKCAVFEWGEKCCDGSDNLLKGSKVWYSKEVPGWTVKLEGRDMKMTCTRFEVKK